jgi:hypothetical protein
VLRGHRVERVEPERLPSPRTAVLVDVGPDDDPADVRLLGAPPLDARPGDVQLGEGGLEQVVGPVPVAADAKAIRRRCVWRAVTNST